MAMKRGNCYPNQAVVSGEKSVYKDLPLNFFMERYAESFTMELKSFTQAVLDNRPTEVTGIDGRIPVAKAMAARKSYDEHRPVRLEEVGG
jgi:myo-inositol 2-dehydrogenase/D-chiro-inositol 1-dehydrogenase